MNIEELSLIYAISPFVILGISSFVFLGLPMIYQSIKNNIPVQTKSDVKC